MHFVRSEHFLFTKCYGISLSVFRALAGSIPGMLQEWKLTSLVTKARATAQVKLLNNCSPTL